MHYADYRRKKLPIASGVMEASCKTLVTQRMKRSGMAWTPQGGQAILTLRSLIQSERWSAAWEVLRADFCKTVIVPETPSAPPQMTLHEPALSRQSAKTLEQAAYAALPLAV